MPIVLVMLAAVAGPADTGDLVRQLGHPQFGQRQRAELDLLSQAGASLPALRQGLGDDDPEIRRRCVRLIPLVEARDRATRVARLLDGHDDPTLPGWMRFRQACGEGPDERRLYADLLAAHGPLLAAWQGNEPGIMNQFQRLCAQVGAGLRATSPNASTSLPPEGDLRIDLATVLLLAPALVDDYITSGRHACEAVQPMRWRCDGPAQAPFRRLFAHWLAQAPDRRVQAQLLSIAGDGFMAECLPVSLRIATDPTANPNVRALSLLVIARLGDRSNVNSLRSILRDSSSVYAGVEIDGVSYDIEIGDVALAVSIHLAGGDPRTFGFAAFGQTAERPAWRTYVGLGFRDPVARSAAQERWQSWPARPR